MRVKPPDQDQQNPPALKPFCHSGSSVSERINTGPTLKHKHAHMWPEMFQTVSLGSENASGTTGLVRKSLLSAVYTHYN